jgi:dTDP-4-dehydrorhamnose 3,5-epimerase-like enzyme
MNVVTTDLPGVLIIEPKVFGDERGSSTKASTQRLSKKRPA